jgi:hypothetical protein
MENYALHTLSPECASVGTNSTVSLAKVFKISFPVQSNSALSADLASLSQKFLVVPLFMNNAG